MPSPKPKAKQPHPGWGGARKGAGRKPVGTERMVKVTVTLSQTDIATLNAINAKNHSAAVRSLIQTYQA